jgi:hypothetical protein
MPCNVAQQTSHTHSAQLDTTNNQLHHRAGRAKVAQNIVLPQKSTCMRLLLSCQYQHCKNPLLCDTAQQLTKAHAGESCTTHQRAIPPCNRATAHRIGPARTHPVAGVDECRCCCPVLPSTRQDLQNKASPLQHPHPHAKQQQLPHYARPAFLFCS